MRFLSYISFFVGVLLIAQCGNAEITLFCDHRSIDGVCAATVYSFSDDEIAAHANACTTFASGTVVPSCSTDNLLGHCTFTDNKGAVEDFSFYEAGSPGVSGTITSQNAYTLCTSTNANATWTPKTN